MGFNEPSDAFHSLLFPNKKTLTGVNHQTHTVMRLS